jgi:hypothetical protein
MVRKQLTVDVNKRATTTIDIISANYALGSCVTKHYLLVGKRGMS